MQPKITPVFFCKRCGEPVYLYANTRDDPTGALMERVVASMSKLALCEFHRKQQEYYIQQGRLEDWEAGRL
jgi:hypothetical protein